MDTYSHGCLPGLLRHHLHSLSLMAITWVLFPASSCMDGFSLTHQCLYPQCQRWSPPMPRMGHCLPVMLSRAPWYAAPDPGLIHIILLPVDEGGSAVFFPGFCCQTGSAVFPLARVGEEYVVKYPIGSYSSRCFCIGLRHCCILGDSQWQSRQARESGSWPSSSGAWNNQNVCWVLSTCNGPLAKPDAAFGACLYGEAYSVD